MKRLQRIGALLLIIVLCLSAIPVSAASEKTRFLTTSGGQLNPQFDGGKVTETKRQVFFSDGSSQQTDPVFTTEKQAVDFLYNGFKQHTSRMYFTYHIDYALPTEQTAFDAAVRALIYNLLDKAFAENEQDNEGDYLRYSYHSYTFGAGADVGSNSSIVYIKLDFSYLTTPEQESELTSQLNTLISSFGFTEQTDELTKIKTIYDFITSHVVYDHENLENEDYTLKFSAYAALMHGRAVCEGYATLFYRMARMCGLRARVITGSGNNERDANHAWNIVAIGDTFYYVDATWDAEQINYLYFLKGDSDFGSHTNEAKYDTPEFRAVYPIAETGYVFDTEQNKVKVSGNYHYTVSGGKATIVDYTGNEEHIIVPATLDTIPVTNVSGAFYGNDTVKSITYSEGIVGNSVSAIDYCKNLTAIHYPSTMQLSASASYGFTDAPSNCPNLSTITVSPESPYMQVVDGVLYSKDMTKLILCPPADNKTNFTIPDGVTLIGPEAFADHKTMVAVVMPDSITQIASFAFSAAYTLEKADLPAKCEYIGQYIFAHTKVTSIHIPKTVNQIHYFPFDLCYPTQITIDPQNEYFKVTDGMLHSATRLIRSEVDTEGAVTVPDGIEYIDNGAFLGANKIASLSLPDSLMELGNHVFEECDGLTHLTIPEGVEILGDLLFCGCDNLTSVIIPESITDFGDFLFHPYNHITIYGGDVAQQISWTVPAKYYPLDQFVCHNGHNLQEVVTVDNQYEKKYYFACSVCSCRTNDYYHRYPQISEAKITLSFTEATYTGELIVPEVVSVVYQDRRLKEGIDYSIRYPNQSINAGTSSVFIDAMGEFRGFQSVPFKILHADITTANIRLLQTGFVYEGQPIQPEFSVQWNGKELIRYEDYGFYYENNNTEGTATLVVTGNQNFKGEKRIDFTINEHEHYYEPTQIDDATHQGICICGRKNEITTHTFDDGCDSYCNDCYYYRAPLHEFSKSWSGDDNNHFHRCIHCGTPDAIERHTGGTATCSSAKVCTVCNRAYGDTLPHDWDMQQWKTDPTYHYHPCKNCSAGEYHATHNGGQASCTEMGKCADCGYEYLDTVPHRWGDWVKTDSTHERFCLDCRTSEGVHYHTIINKVCTLCGYTQAPSNPFSDVKETDYFYTPVLWAVQNEVTAGLTPSSFGPQSFCTRAQVVTFLWRAAGKPNPRGLNNPFKDVNNQQYYYKAVLWAVENGITAGTDATHFAPNATCTRSQIVTFLYRFAKEPAVSGNNPFKDVTQQQYYYKAVLWAVKSGITAGIDFTHFAPNDTCTRGQVVSFLYRYIR